MDGTGQKPGVEPLHHFYLPLAMVLALTRRPNHNWLQVRKPASLIQSTQHTTQGGKQKQKTKNIF
jgi:hypothetical protein